MNEQVRLFLPHLKEGATYIFEHQRKGQFIAIFRSLQPTKEGDASDELWVEVDVYTESGSGQEYLANAWERNVNGQKVRPKFSKKLLRPSLLTAISSPASKDERKLQTHVDEVAATVPVELVRIPVTTRELPKLERKALPAVKQGFVWDLKAKVAAAVVSVVPVTGLIIYLL